MEFLLVILGLLGLWFRTDLALDGAMDVSKRMRLLMRPGFTGECLVESSRDGWGSVVALERSEDASDMALFGSAGHIAPTAPP